jgi:Protein of unknown function (DUF433)
MLNASSRRHWTSFKRTWSELGRAGADQPFDALAVDHVLLPAALEIGKNRKNRRKPRAEPFRLPQPTGVAQFRSVILGGLAEGLSPEEIIGHYPQLTIDDIHGALAYAAALSRENVWKGPIGR